MATNKKPRKKYRPQPVSANRIKAFRFNAEGDLWLKMHPHAALEAMRDGSANAQHMDTLVLRIMWGARMAKDHLVDADDARAILARGVSAVTSVADRYARLQKFGSTGEEFGHLGDALNVIDDMQNVLTRREMESSLQAVLKESRCQVRVPA